jgi:hypothetical protein
MLVHVFSCVFKATFSHGSQLATQVAACAHGSQLVTQGFALELPTCSSRKLCKQVIHAFAMSKVSATKCFGLFSAMVSCF